MIRPDTIVQYGPGLAQNLQPSLPRHSAPGYELLPKPLIASVDADRQRRLQVRRRQPRDGVGHTWTTR